MFFEKTYTFILDQRLKNMLSFALSALFEQLWMFNYFCNNKRVKKSKKWTFHNSHLQTWAPQLRS